MWYDLHKHSPTSGHLGCFQFFALINRGAAIKILMQTSK